MDEPMDHAKSGGDDEELELHPQEATVDRFIEAIMQLVSTVPQTTEPESEQPQMRARDLTQRASFHAGSISAGLSLPPGPMGWLTVLPDLMAVWRIQAQLVADIAASYGKSVTLTREQMVYCLFRHAAAQAVRDLIMRAGQRIFVRRATGKVWRKMLQGVATRIGGRIAGRSVARWLPIIGAAGVGAYAYYDTWRVGQTAIDIFSHDIEVEAELVPDEESDTDSTDDRQNEQ